MTEPGLRELLDGRVDAEAADRLAVYGELLERWSTTHSLVRFSSRKELVERHILESLEVVPFLPERGVLADVGSGAGLPGIPVLVVRPEWTGVLLEPRGKRWAFLRRVVSELGLAAEVKQTRYEQYSGGPFDAVTVRALGRPEELAIWARKRLAGAGFVALWTTEDGCARLGTLKGWRVLSSALPRLERGRLARLYPCFT